MVHNKKEDLPHFKTFFRLFRLFRSFVRSLVRSKIFQILVRVDAINFAQNVQFRAILAIFRPSCSQPEESPPPFFRRLYYREYGFPNKVPLRAFAIASGRRLGQAQSPYLDRFRIVFQLLFDRFGSVSNLFGPFSDRFESFSHRF